MTPEEFWESWQGREKVVRTDQFLRVRVLPDGRHAYLYCARTVCADESSARQMSIDFHWAKMVNFAWFEGGHWQT